MARLTLNTPILSLLDCNKPEGAFLPALLQVLDYTEANASLGNRTRPDWRDLLTVFNNECILNTYENEDIYEEAFAMDMDSYAQCLLDSWAREKGR